MTSAVEERHRARSLRWIVAGVGASSLGGGLGVVALPLLALRLTSDPLLISGVAIAEGLPWLLVALPAGALVDRTDRKRLVLLVEAGRALVLAMAAIGVAASRLPIGALYGVAFLIGAGETVVSAVLRVSVPLVVEPERRARANGTVSAAQSVGQQLAGPAIGGALFSLAHALPFLGNAACYAVSGFLERAGTPVSDVCLQPHDQARFGSDVANGVRWFAESRALRMLAAVIGSFAFCQAMVFSVLVLYATDDLHLGPTGYGLLVGIPAIADVASNLVAHRAYDRLGGTWTLVVSGVFAGCAYLALGATTVLVVAGAALVLETIATATGNVASVTMRQELIPRARFGLVNNAMRMCVLGLAPLGALAGGLLSSGFGTRVAFVVAGMVQLAALGVSGRALGSAMRAKYRGQPEHVAELS